MANNKNLASGTLVAGITTSSTTLTVYVGDGNSSTVQGVWPTAPFYATVMPSLPEAGVSNSLDSEIVQVTAVSSDQDNNTTLTVTRAQKDTTAKSFDAGAVVTNAIYTDEVAQASGTVGGPINPVYLDNGVITAANTQSSGNNYNIVPKVSAAGVMDIGRYIDLHNSASGTTDYTTRIEANADGNLYIQGGGSPDVSVGIGVSIRGANTKIGDLSSLVTTSKNNLVAAINEVDSTLDDAAYVGPVLSTPTSVDYVATDNIQDGAVTTDKIATGAVTADKIDLTTFKNVLKPGDSLTITGDSIPNNVKYFAQWNDSQNKFDVLVPLNVLFSSDVSTLSVSFANNAVTYFPQGTGGSALNVSFDLISYSFDTGLCIRCTPASTVSHTTSDIFAVRLPIFTITAS